MNDTALRPCVVVLHQPRNIVNIGGVVRAMKNMGLARLRLVNPVAFDRASVRGIAHSSDDVLAALQTFDSLEGALADAHYVVGTTARTRTNHTVHTVHTDVRTLAATLVQRTHAGEQVALLFGPEDCGLDNAALDMCHTIVRLPTVPTYGSLNLAQAVLLLAYELRMAAMTMPGPEPEPEPGNTPHTTPAPVAQQETMFAALEQALWAIAFIKSGNATPHMRTLRGLLGRAAPTMREAALLTAIAREVVHVIRRLGKDNTGNANTPDP